MNRVWYVAYGSNLGLSRFRCYLAGGRPPGGARHYAGCRDPSEPLRTVSLQLPGGLVFAGRSGVWGGGMAFLDRRAPRQVACRAYLVTAEQFSDVVAQETRRPPGGEFARELARRLGDGELPPRVATAGYDTVAPLGEHDDAPLLTITRAQAATMTPVAPSAVYLRWIAAGLVEAHGWETERIAAYLADAPGIPGAWTGEAIRELALRGRPTKARGS